MSQGTKKKLIKGCQNGAEKEVGILKLVFAWNLHNDQTFEKKLDNQSVHLIEKFKLIFFIKYEKYV